MSTVGMFNSEQKQNYIDSDKANKDALRRYFLRLAPKEKDYAKDIYEMTQAELIDTLKSLNIRREDTRGHLLSLLRGYVDWARFKGLPGCQTIIHLLSPESISSDDIINNTMIKDPDHLQEILNDGLDYENYENRSKITSLLFKLLYQGLDLDQIRNLQKDDLDYATNMVKLADGSLYEVDAHIAPLWEECAAITFIEKRNGRADTAKSSKSVEFIKYDLADNNYLIRTIAGDKGDTNMPCSLNQLRKMISRVFMANEAKTIPARNINYSGIFYKLYMHEKAGNEITPQLIAEKFFVKYETRTELLANTRKWRIDFEDWRIAFGYS